MEIQFSLDEADLHALAEHQIRRSPLIPQRIRRRQIAYVVGFALLAIGTYLSGPERPVSYVFALLALLFLLLYPPLARRRITASIPSLVRAKMTESSLGERRLRAVPDGLEQLSQNSQSKVVWQLVGPVETGAAHLFISIDGIYSVVIPTDRITSGDIASFVEAVAKYGKAAA